MADILYAGPAPDQPGHTRFVLAEGVEGTVTGTVSDLSWPDDLVDGGRVVHRKGDPVGTVSATLRGQRELVLAGSLSRVSFPDGTVWQPPAAQAATGGGVV